MTPSEKIKKIRELCEKATPGPWDDKPASKEWLDNIENNASFLRKSRTIIPALLKERDILREALVTINRLSTNSEGFEINTCRHAAFYSIEALDEADKVIEGIV